MSERPMLNPAVMSRFRRERLMNACAELVADHGFYNITVGDIVSRARVARNTFYDLFSNKAECFEQTVGWIADKALTAVDEAVAAGDSFETKLDGSVDALVDFVNEQPGWARCVLIEAPAGAPDLHEYTLRRFAKMTELPAPIDEMLAGGVAWVLYRHLVERDSGEDLAEGLRQFCHNCFAAAALQTA